MIKHSVAKTCSPFIDEKITDDVDIDRWENDGGRILGNTPH